MKWVEAPTHEPTVLSRFREANPDGEWGQFKDELHPESLAVFDALAAAQGHLCAYCEIRIARGGPGQVEHFVPKSKGGGHLDFANMLAACEGGTITWLKGDRALPPIPQTMHCGQLKADLDPHDVIVDPRTLPPSPPIWDITRDGRLFPHEGRCHDAGILVTIAASTLDRLGLNRRGLVEKRKQLLKDIEEAAYTTADLDWLLSAEHEALPEFYTTYVLGVSPTT